MKLQEEKHQGIKADNHEIKVCLVRYISDSIFTLFLDLNHSISQSINFTCLAGGQ